MMSTNKELMQTAVTINDISEKLARRKSESNKIADTIPNRMVEGDIVINNPKTRMEETKDDRAEERPDIVKHLGKDSHDDD